MEPLSPAAGFRDAAGPAGRSKLRDRTAGCAPEPAPYGLHAAAKAPIVRLLLPLLFLTAGPGCGSDRRPSADPPPVAVAPPPPQPAGPSGNPREEETRLRRLVRSQPRDAQAWSDLGIARAQLGRMDEAVEAWKRAMALDKRLVAPRFNYAVLLSRQGKPDEALRLLDQVRQEAASNPAVLRFYGETALSAGESSGAVVAFSDLLAADANDLEALLGLIEARLVRKEFAEAPGLIARASALDPENPRLLLLRAHHHLETAGEEALKQDEFGAQLQRALAHPELRAKAAYLLGRLRLRQGRAGEAVTLFRLPLDANPRDLDARYLLARSLEQAGRAEESRRELRRYHQLFRLQIRAAAARARSKRGDAAQARSLDRMNSEEERLLELR